ncbi:stressosome-associated protein Prli42 [Enterococcus aquimarinus]|mgnify:FL=1|nr:stressosome-associated protein Prli42 [Enterococcus aquimarinus]MBP6359408.1 stressosome-associated protein Prli42 [Enterococcus sp.]MBP7085433.1 stressosome-associated protein Prli42 [Enterococcus sp.]MBP7952618.1 stressosome-associated protein Prli42 [Enterococcus sp.]MBP8693408.1 stressosome-associated protein Prli42 [Enterococcus sp.]MBP9521361.1 stressosome-associated protein Prli42 [Enterococcus sp.]
MKENKKTSTFSKVTKIVVWIMLIVMLGTTVLTALSALQ